MTSTTIDHVPANKGRKLPPEPLTAQEVKALIAPVPRGPPRASGTGADRHALPGRLADQRSAGAQPERP